MKYYSGTMSTRGRISKSIKCPQPFKQGVQGLQAFAFYVLTVNDEHTKQTYDQKKA